MDEHNGRFCVTPEYPEGIYCYFATVDEQWNSAFPYVVGPTFFGVKSASSVSSVTESTQTFESTNSVNEGKSIEYNVFPIPTADVLIVQTIGINTETVFIELFDINGKKIEQKTMNAGSTMCYLDVSTLYSGSYFLRVHNSKFSKTEKIEIN